MDATPLPDRPCLPHHTALILQGGGALGAYQGGVFQAMDEAGIAPNWLCGVSIGAINSAIIAGNAPKDRLPRLRAFWELITPERPSLPFIDGDLPRRFENEAAAMSALALGQPGFFKPNLPGPFFSLPGSKQATAFYDTGDLRASLLRFIDFDRLNSGETRCAVGAVNVETGNFAYFDNDSMTLGPEHIMASGALPPGFPMVEIGMEYFWDGALISNTPLMHLLLNIESCSALVFQVDLFSARGPIPRTLRDVGLRQKEIGYSSRTRLVTDFFKREFALKNHLRSLLDRMPEERLTPEDQAERLRLRNLPRLSVLELIYEHAVYEGESRDYEFSRRSMLDHWNRGYRQTQQTLGQKDWLLIPAEAGIVSHDINRDRS
ncbi:patatin-like phospholipase family protein [Acidisoma silvae]|uniref:Patatin-like phospholipase family protein n=1 Tax=Acidisoma silvae TaxID=2802396 RepID=A0A964DXQ5_9PROT|nr:patatin-like phospholipase family protein [Acidisoma silvae]MCB8874456.1 patatin-like phospholipase family protein [Acidisoma silvae]